MATTVLSNASGTPTETLTFIPTVTTNNGVPSSQTISEGLVSGVSGAGLQTVAAPLPAPAVQGTNSTSQDTTLHSFTSSVSTSSSSSHSAVSFTSFHSKLQSTSTSAAPNHPVSPSQSPKSSSNHSLSNGTVAGIVVASAIGLALITFLLTFMFMRHKRRQNNRNQQNYQGHPGKPDRESLQIAHLEPKAPLIPQTSISSNEIEAYLPQSVDDATLRNKVRTMLDQMELHVENFYQNAPGPGSRSNDSTIAMFDSPTLQHPLPALLMRSPAALPLIKHALVYFTTAKISLSGQLDASLLPDEFIVLPSTITAVDSGSLAKPGNTSSAFYSCRTILKLTDAQDLTNPYPGGEC